MVKSQVKWSLAEHAERKFGVRDIYCGNLRFFSVLADAYMYGMEKT
jgi:hypothetical protein